MYLYNLSLFRWIDNPNRPQPLVNISLKFVSSTRKTYIYGSKAHFPVKENIKTHQL